METSPFTTPVATPTGAASSRPPAQPSSLDRLIRARAIHSMTGEVYRSVGLRGAEIAAVSPEPDGLDDLADAGTLRTNADDLTLLPAFADSHEHLLEASRNTLLVPVTPVRDTAERSLADAILESGRYRQHNLPEGTLLSERPIADTEVHLLLDGLLLIEADHQPVLEAGPGAIFDPSARTSYSKQHITVRAATACRLAVLSRAHLDSQALLGVATEQRPRLDTARRGQPKL
jgi:hypothetical protein